MQFEWAVKHENPRNKGGIHYRLKKLESVMQKERWTKNSPLSNTVPLTIEFIEETHIQQPINSESHLQHTT